MAPWTSQISPYRLSLNRDQARGYDPQWTRRVGPSPLLTYLMRPRATHPGVANTSNPPRQCPATETSTGVAVVADPRIFSPSSPARRCRSCAVQTAVTMEISAQAPSKATDPR